MRNYELTLQGKRLVYFLQMFGYTALGVVVMTALAMIGM